MLQFRHQAGFTLLELLVVLACLSLALTVALQQPARLAPATAALRSVLIQGRLEAVSHGVPVAITFDNALRQYRMRQAAGSETLAQLCAASGSPVLHLAEYRGVSQAGSFPGLVWLPTGSGRSCSSGAVYNQTITLQQGRREARIIVSRAGRVRSEIAPR